MDDFFLTDATSNRADSNISYRDRTRFRKMLELIIERDLRVVDFHSGTKPSSFPFLSHLQN